VLMVSTARPTGNHPGMNTHHTPVPEADLMNALRGDAQSVADIAKATKAEKEDVEGTLIEWRQRQLVDIDEGASTAKTERWRLTDLGRNQADTRYPQA
jgi:DNA-directed RNA polymerase specialized sigma subunit